MGHPFIIDVILPKPHENDPEGLSFSLVVLLSFPIRNPSDFVGPEQLLPRSRGGIHSCGRYPRQLQTDPSRSGSHSQLVRFLLKSSFFLKNLSHNRPNPPFITCDDVEDICPVPDPILVDVVQSSSCFRAQMSNRVAEVVTIEHLEDFYFIGEKVDFEVVLR